MASMCKSRSRQQTPISLMEDLGFQMIIDPLIKALEPNAAINCQNKRQEVSKVAALRFLIGGL